MLPPSFLQDPCPLDDERAAQRGRREEGTFTLLLTGFQSNTVGRLWCFWGGDALEYPGGLLRLDPAFAYAEPPSS